MKQEPIPKELKEPTLMSPDEVRQKYVYNFNEEVDKYLNIITTGLEAQGYMGTYCFSITTELPRSPAVQDRIVAIGKENGWEIVFKDDQYNGSWIDIKEIK